MVSNGFQTGDLVWARMKGFPPWPAKIVDPPSGVKIPKNKKSHYVQFFGTEDFAWIVDEHIIPHSEKTLNTYGKKKSASFQKAIDALMNHSKSAKAENQSPPKVKRDKHHSESQSSPKVKRDKHHSKNKNLGTKVVKVIPNVTKKPGRQVLTGKPVHKTHKKRSLEDSNGAYSPSKRPKLFEEAPSSLKNLSLYKYSPHVNKQKFYESFLSHGNTDRKHVQPSTKKFGFIGLGQIGSDIVKNMIESGHDVTIFTRSSLKYPKFEEIGAKRAKSPMNLIMECDITFSCVTDPEASKALIFGENGILKGLEEAEKNGQSHKGYVEMTSIDSETSLGIHEAINMKHGLYLEAPVSGTIKYARDGKLLVLAAGDRRLFSECETCFHAIGNHAYYLSCDVGYASNVNLILNTLSGTVCALVAETIVLVERLGLEKNVFLNILNNGPLCCEAVVEKYESMHRRNFESVKRPLKYMQKDLDLALQMADESSQPMTVAATVNELFKYARLLKLSDSDDTAVYEAVRL